MTDANETELQKVTRQRDTLAEAIRNAAYDAEMLNPGMSLSGPQLLMLVKDMGDAARDTVWRNKMLAKLEQSDERIIIDVDAMEAIQKLDKSYYRTWRRDTMAGDDLQGYVSGNIPTNALATVIEYARHQLIENGGMVASPTPTGQDERQAIEHAMDVLSKHGDGTTSAGAMEILQNMLDRRENAPSIASELPEITDNVMAKANQVVKDMTGVAKPGIIGPVVEAVWQAMKEDREQLIRQHETEDEGDSESQSEGSTDDQTDAGAPALEPTFDLPRDHPLRLWPEVKKHHDAYINDREGSGGTYKYRIDDCMQEFVDAALSGKYADSFTKQELNFIEWAAKVVINQDPEDPLTKSVVDRLSGLMETHQKRDQSARLDAMESDIGKRINFGEPAMKSPTTRTAEAEEAAKNRFLKKLADKHPDLNNDQDPDNDPSPGMP